MFFLRPIHLNKRHTELVYETRMKILDEMYKYFVIKKCVEILINIHYILKANCTGNPTFNELVQFLCFQLVHKSRD